MDGPFVVNSNPRAYIYPRENRKEFLSRGKPQSRYIQMLPTKINKVQQTYEESFTTGGIR